MQEGLFVDGYGRVRDWIFRSPCTLFALLGIVELLLLLRRVAPDSDVAVSFLKDNRLCFPIGSAGCVFALLLPLSPSLSLCQLSFLQYHRSHDCIVSCWTKFKPITAHILRPLFLPHQSTSPSASPTPTPTTHHGNATHSISTSTPFGNSLTAIQLLAGLGHPPPSIPPSDPNHLSYSLFISAKFPISVKKTVTLTTFSELRASGGRGSRRRGRFCRRWGPAGRMPSGGGAGSWPET